MVSTRPGQHSSGEPREFRRHRSPKRWQLVAMIVSLAVGFTILAPVDEPAAEAAISRWKRIPDRVFSGLSGSNVQLGTRGYIDDSCIDLIQVTCLSASNHARPEATAQALAIQFLRFRRLDFGLQKVDWEVGPSSSTDRSGTTPEPPGEPDDPCDPEVPGFVKEGHWRIDVVADQRSIIEVKRWEGPATTTNVNNQLNCYVTRAGQLGVQFERSRELNAVSWAVPFLVPAEGPIWRSVHCAWAPAENAGHIYFAPITDSTAAARCGAPISKVLLAIAREAERLGIPRSLIDDNTPPLVDPPYRETASGDETPEWAVEVLEDADSERQVRFEYGDGQEVTVTVEPGNGSQTFNFSRSLPFGTYGQVATVLGVLSATGAALAYRSTTKVLVAC